MPSTVGIIREEVSGSPAHNTPERLEQIKGMLMKGFELCGGLERVVHPGDKVFVKPNFFSPQNPEMGTGTDPGVVGALVGLLREAGARRVYVGENPALVKARVALEKTGAGAMITAEGGELSCLDEEIYIECLNQDAKILRSVHLPHALLEADVFITVPKVKTHLMTLLTLGIKNSMGLLKDEDKRLRYHSESLHQKLVDLLYYRKPDFVIEDAIVAAEGQGPVCPEPVQMNLLAFSKDVVAADAVISAIAGFLPEEITMTRLAGALGLGAGRLEEITIQSAPMAEVRRVFKRAIYSPVGFLPDVEVYAGGACVPCLGILRSALEQFRMEGAIDLAKNCTFLIGANAPLPSRFKEKVVVIGDCAEKHKDLGIFVPGCPPVPGLKIMKALGLVPEWSKSFFEKADV